MLDVQSMAQQRDEAFAEAEFEEFQTKKGWYCLLEGVVGVGETPREAFNDLWGKKMGKVKSQVTEEMEVTGMDIEEVLEKRGSRYGEYQDVSNTAQSLKEVLRSRSSWLQMEPFMQESLDMICNKLARIANGDPYYKDSWVDVTGYATLVVKELEKGDVSA